MERMGGGEVHAGFWSVDLREGTTWKTQTQMGGIFKKWNGKA